MIKKLSGDIEGTKGYDEQLTSIKLAQTISDIVCSKNKWNWVHIKFSNRETKETMGYFNYDTHTIVLNKGGENIGTLIHELSHYNAKGHKKRFKNNQKRIITFLYKSL